MNRSIKHTQRSHVRFKSSIRVFSVAPNSTRMHYLDGWCSAKKIVTQSSPVVLLQSRDVFGSIRYITMVTTWLIIIAPACCFPCTSMFVMTRKVSNYCFILLFHCHVLKYNLYTVHAYILWQESSHRILIKIIDSDITWVDLFANWPMKTANQCILDYDNHKASFTWGVVAVVIVVISIPVGPDHEF